MARDLLTIRRAKVGALAIGIVEISDEIRRRYPNAKEAQQYADKIEELAIAIMEVRIK